MEILLTVLWPIGGFVTAQITQRIIVPILIYILGAKRFASPSAFDGCTLSIYGTLAAFVIPTFLKAPRSPIHGPLWWTFPLIALGITLYGLVWLWALGWGAKKREWGIGNGRILNRENEELHPTFMKKNIEYHQTDAFNGYSHYFLELHDNEKLLAINAYTSEDEFLRDAKRVSEMVGARRLDLIWLYRIEPKKWLYVRFPDEWATILCGPLDGLSEDDREWWHSWMLPSFTERVGETVDTSDARERMKRFRETYTPLQPLDDIGRVWANYHFSLDQLLAVGGPIIAVDNARFLEMACNEVGKPYRGVQLRHDTDGYAILS